MTAWQREEIEVESGEKVSAQMPVIVSASRSTDIPAFYSDWFVERFSFIDIAAYKKVAANLERGGIKAREFQPSEMEELAGRIGKLAKGWGIKAATCGEIKDLERERSCSFRQAHHASPLGRAVCAPEVD